MGVAATMILFAGCGSPKDCDDAGCTETEYCEVIHSRGLIGVTTTVQCRPLPQACLAAGAGCECLAEEPCNVCSDDASSGFSVSCPAE